MFDVQDFTFKPGYDWSLTYNTGIRASMAFCVQLPLSVMVPLALEMFAIDNILSGCVCVFW